MIGTWRGIDEHFSIFFLHRFVPGSRSRFFRRLSSGRKLKRRGRNEKMKERQVKKNKNGVENENMNILKKSCIKE